MADSLQVNAPDLFTKAQSIGNRAEDLRDELLRWVTGWENLSHTWEGSAAKAYSRSSSAGTKMPPDSSRYRLRLAGGYSTVLGSLSQVEWRGKRYAIEGEAMIHNSSTQTRHVDHVIVTK